MVATSTFALPARGVFPGVELLKKAPKHAEALIVLAVKGEDGLELCATSLLDAGATRTVFDSLVAVGATGKAGELKRVPAPAKSGFTSVVALGLDNMEDFDSEQARRTLGSAARHLRKVETAVIDVPAPLLASSVEGVLLGGYEYRGIHSPESSGKDKAKSKDKAKDEAAEKKQPGTFYFIGGKDQKDAFEHAKITAESVILARDLVNAPANVLYPESYAQFISAESKEAGLDVEILDEKELEKQGFGGILAVGKGSQRPPRLVRVTWSPKKAKKTVALVGKGITFDTGGISLKPGNGMWDMISDMGGSAAMVASVLAAAKLEIPVKVVATLPLAENMPSGSATRPGDVITHYGGITSEVLNTDAEGRLVLADAIARASEDDPDYLIDTATLTGAQIVALGSRTAGVMGTADFRDRVAEVGREVGENAWAMPLLEEHDEEISTPAADIRNIHVKREGGMEFAATYLQRFVEEDIAWAHIDVAGPAWNGSGPRGYTPKRATGVPVRTVVAVLEEIAAQDKK
ncbi:leucyl aminopeptidase [Corynebacterium flavescens]|uniref:leucyl aminopeptidase n=2 Tax=Corynebacterium flavescens TaxID=28028 RepID=UPI002649AB42|nr:leucyl aminopeptidase [Corynebacterium flavescens]MDN6227570.1 leucyl aminopeptidase [Corynebacterium flavescens]